MTLNSNSSTYAVPEAKNLEAAWESQCNHCGILNYSQYCAIQACYNILENKWFYKVEKKEDKKDFMKDQDYNWNYQLFPLLRF